MAQRRRSNPGPEAEAPHQIYSEVADVGKHVTGSKKRATWKFCFGEDGEEHQVVLIHSVVSGKKVIEHDNREVLNVQKIGAEYSHAWVIEGRVYRIEIQELQEFPYMFSIDNIPFRAMPSRNMLRRPMPKQRSTKVSESPASSSTPPRRTSHTKLAHTAPAASSSSQKTFDPFGFDNSTPQSAPSTSKPADPFAGGSFAAFPPAPNGTTRGADAFSNDAWGSPAAATTTGTTAGNWAAFPAAGAHHSKADEIMNDFAGLTFEDMSQKQRAQEEKEAQERQLQQQQRQLELQRQQEEEAAQKKKGVDAWEVASHLVASGNLLDSNTGLHHQQQQQHGPPRSSPSLNQLAGKAGTPASGPAVRKQPMMGGAATMSASPAATATTSGMGYDVLTPAAPAHMLPAAGPAHVAPMAYQPRGSAAISMMNMDVVGGRGPALGMGAMPPYHAGMARGPVMGGPGMGAMGGPGMGGAGMGAMGGMGGAGAMGRGAAGGMSGGAWGGAQRQPPNSLDNLDAFRGL